ncbi:hypothetical protein [Streptomyces sp. DSM 40907]|uniref:hypothetical protein n=1 Tax=Streptomyces kutzneri TaxID=3051179 RepID=UPI0028D5C1ED|nr:hypothetical protein [Streptomyces sp. DSM 40907]
MEAARLPGDRAVASMPKGGASQAFRGERRDGGALGGLDRTDAYASEDDDWASGAEPVR